MRQAISIAIFFILGFRPSSGQVPGEKLLQRVKCSADPSQEYSLYLPPGYDATLEYPVIIFLDPGARGDVPVYKYRGLGERYKMILAGSFNSSNFAAGSSIKAFVAIYNDLLTKHGIDTSFVLLSGFSGGSRVASEIAMEYKEVKGVIGCGAGFADNNSDAFVHLPPYAALTGDRDMNYGELMDNHQLLDELKLNNILLIFDGEHVWPPVLHTELALLWLMDQSGRTGFVPSTENDPWKRIAEKADSGFLYAAWFEAKQLEKISFYEQQAIAITSGLEKRKGFSADKKLFEKIMEDEQNTMNEFSISFSQLLVQPHEETIDNTKWSQQSERIQRLRKDKNRYRQLSGQRCYDHSTRSCQEYYFQLAGIRNFSKCLDIAQVLIALDPANRNSYYLLARAEAAIGNKNNAEKQLKEAIKRGLTWNKRVEEDSLLSIAFTADELKKIFENK